jgi:hypothetical protein
MGEVVSNPVGKVDKGGEFLGLLTAKRILADASREDGRYVFRFHGS